MLATYLTEIESPINGRPLIPISDEGSNMEALTPNNFRLGRSNPNEYPIQYHRIMSATFVQTGNLYTTCYQYFGNWIADYFPLLA